MHLNPNKAVQMGQKVCPVALIGQELKQAMTKRQAISGRMGQEPVQRWLY
jgi:hypothetical protein